LQVEVRASTKVRLSPSYTNWEIGVQPPLIFTFQRNDFWVLEIDIPVSRSGKGLLGF
jgi:hypothetical protein